MTAKEREREQVRLIDEYLSALWAPERPPCEVVAFERYRGGGWSPPVPYSEVSEWSYSDLVELMHTA